jgi:hypothetical protein
MKIDYEEIFKRIKIFILNIPHTIKETFQWILISYLIPFVNIGIIWGMKNNTFELTTEIYSIFLATNACFFTSLFYLVFTEENKKNNRKLIKTFNIASFVITVVLFSVSIIEIEKKETFFSKELYFNGSLWTFIIAVFMALISKYDEAAALSENRAKESKSIKKTNVDGKTIEL